MACACWGRIFCGSGVMIGVWMCGVAVVETRLEDKFCGRGLCVLRAWLKLWAWRVC